MGRGGKRRTLRFVQSKPLNCVVLKYKGLVFFQFVVVCSFAEEKNLLGFSLSINVASSNGGLRFGAAVMPPPLRRVQRGSGTAQSSTLD